MTISKILVFIAANNLQPNDLVDVQCSLGTGLCDEPTLALTDAGTKEVPLPTLTIRTSQDADALSEFLGGMLRWTP